jgi:hypothetical protein
VSFDECWVVSPEFALGFRPALDTGTPPEKILQWRALKLTWCDALPGPAPHQKSGYSDSIAKVNL